jgi:hypothetical protein
VELASGSGESVLEFSFEELLRGALDEGAVGGLCQRVEDLIEEKASRAVRSRIRDWVAAHECASEASFDDEFCRRCDGNDEIVEALEWLNPQPPSDEEREWTSRMATIFMAQMHNEELNSM